MVPVVRFSAATEAIRAPLVGRCVLLDLLNDEQRKERRVLDQQFELSADRLLDGARVVGGHRVQVHPAIVGQQDLQFDQLPDRLQALLLGVEQEIVERGAVRNALILADWVLESVGELVWRVWKNLETY